MAERRRAQSVRPTPARRSRPPAGRCRQEKPAPTAVYVVVDDPDAHFEQARDAGAEIIRELNDTKYGSREYGAKDPEGNAWYFGTYQPFRA